MKTLYFGGAVLPMDRPGKAQALVVENGKILAAGTLEEVEPLVQGARRVDLEGRALLPAFVDGHSHITALAQTLGLCQLSGCGSLEEMGRRMKAFRERWAIPAGEWVIGFGYDQNDLEETCGKAAIPPRESWTPPCRTARPWSPTPLGTWGWSIPWGCKGWASPPAPQTRRGAESADWRTAPPAATWRRPHLPPWAPASPETRKRG